MIIHWIKYANLQRKRKNQGTLNTLLKTLNGGVYTCLKLYYFMKKIKSKEGGCAAVAINTKTAVCNTFLTIKIHFTRKAVETMKTHRLKTLPSVVCMRS